MIAVTVANCLLEPVQDTHEIFDPEYVELGPAKFPKWISLRVVYRCERMSNYTKRRNQQNTAFKLKHVSHRNGMCCQVKTNFTFPMIGQVDSCYSLNRTLVSSRPTVAGPRIWGH